MEKYNVAMKMAREFACNGRVWDHAVYENRSPRRMMNIVSGWTMPYDNAEAFAAFAWSSNTVYHKDGVIPSYVIDGSTVKFGGDFPFIGIDNMVRYVFGYTQDSPACRIEDHRGSGETWAARLDQIAAHDFPLRFQI